jgi:hypothetical protein
MGPRPTKAHENPASKLWGRGFCPAAGLPPGDLGRCCALGNARIPAKRNYPSVPVRGKPRSAGGLAAGSVRPKSQAYLRRKPPALPMRHVRTSLLSNTRARSGCVTRPDGLLLCFGAAHRSPCTLMSHPRPAVQAAPGECENRRPANRFSQSCHLPMRPFDPTTKGSDNAFQLCSGSETAFQLRPSSAELSVPLGPTAIHTLAAES